MGITKLKNDKRSKMRVIFSLIFFIILLRGTIQSFGAVSVVPSQVPKGATVNEPTATDDQYFVQSINIVFEEAIAAGGTITITLPSDLEVADVDGDTPSAYADEIYLSIASAAATNINAASIACDDGTDIVITVGVGGALASGDSMSVVFPIVSSTDASGSDTYSIDYATTSKTATVLYVTRPGLITFDANYSGGDDESNEKGALYPAADSDVIDSDTNLPDFIIDRVGGASQENVVASDDWAGIAALLDNDNTTTNEITFYLWVTQENNLNKISDMLGNGNLVYDSDGTRVTGEEGEAMDDIQLDVSKLSEGTWYFYVTSSVTGNWVLGQSGAVVVHHYPVFATGGTGAGFDYDADGVWQAGSGGADDQSAMTLDGGGVTDIAGTIGGSAGYAGYVDVYWNVQDLDDNADVYIFISKHTTMTEDSVVTSGTSPNLQVTGLGSATILNTTSLTEEDIKKMYTWDIDLGANNYTAAGDYYVYFVACDGKHFNIQIIEASGGTDTKFSVSHYPKLAFQDHYGGHYTLDTKEVQYYLINWGQTVDGDKSRSGTATIKLWVSTSDYLTILLDSDENNQPNTEKYLIENESASCFQVATIIDNSDEPEDNRFLIDVRNAKEKYGYNFTAGATYYIYGIIGQGPDTLAVQLSTSGGLVLDLGERDDCSLTVTHSSYFQPKSPINGETISLGEGDVYEFRWNAYDVDAMASAGKIQAFMVPEGTDLETIASDLVYDGGNAHDFVDITADDVYWLFHTPDGSGPTHADSGAAARMGYFVVDFADITTDMAGNVAKPSGTYDVYYIFSSDGTHDDETAEKADGQLFFNGEQDLRDIYNYYLSPTQINAFKGDTITFTVQANDPDPGADVFNATTIAFYIDVPSDNFKILDQDTSTSGLQPFLDETTNFNNEIFINALDSTSTSGVYQLDFVEMEEGITGTDLDNAKVATFQVVVTKGTSEEVLVRNPITFGTTGTRISHMIAANGKTVGRYVPEIAANIMLAPLGTITGYVDIEGRDDQGEDVTFYLCNVGSFECISDEGFLSANNDNDYTDGIQVSLAENGKYTLSSVPVGEYDLICEKAGWLTSKRGYSGTSSAITVKIYSSTTVNFTNADVLWAGDCAGYDHDGDEGAVTLSLPNNKLGDEDFGAFSTAFNSESGGDNWNEYCDVNGDGKVYIDDVDYWTKNYGAGRRKGDGITFDKKASTQQNITALGQISLIRQVGDEYTYAIHIDEFVGLHAYGIKLLLDDTQWELKQVTNELDNYFYTYFIKKQEGSTQLFAASISGLDYVTDKDIYLVIFTVNAKVKNPAEPKLKELLAVDYNQDSYNLVLSDVETGQNEQPTRFTISQNYPNPFNPKTKIRIALRNEAVVEVAVFNLNGQKVRTIINRKMNSGYHNLEWNSKDDAGRLVSSGVYLYQLKVDGRIVGSHKMVLLK